MCRVEECTYVRMHALVEPIDYIQCAYRLYYDLYIICNVLVLYISNPGIEECTTSGVRSLSFTSALLCVQTYCAIRGSYFELYKNDSLVTKLFLPSMGLHEDLDSKRPWSFKLKNPRREEMLHLAAESDAEYQKWIVALNKACAIQVR